ncbi:proline dehydrogenase family protein [Novosphingobium terrae]|uniref:proline dehydrogenase family protein n=1 Tax=Novosphingobium terrae TaxID=2726189 RepID=UPI0019824908|nr:proline dehydrogenase family protein [Novosphingobium terrae]
MSLRSRLRDARYALPGLLGRHLPAPDAVWAGQQARLWQARGRATSFGWFPGAEDADGVLAGHLALVAALAGQDAVLAVKAPALGLSEARIATLAEAAAQAGVPLLFDAHGPALADATLALVEQAMALHPSVGCALPARWRRSAQDAARLRDQPLSLRIVKGEWADPQGDPADPDVAYLDLVRGLAGRAAPVVVATHDPALAAQALDLLIAAGTPCLLEQLRGLPHRRTEAVARQHGVPLRLYLPTGPGWWAYAIDKALARPYLPLWALRDRLGLKD